MKSLDLYCRYEEAETLHEINGLVLSSEDYGKLNPETEDKLKDKYLVTCSSCRNSYVVGSKVLEKRMIEIKNGG